MSDCSNCITRMRTFLAVCSLAAVVLALGVTPKARAQANDPRTAALAYWRDQLAQAYAMQAGHVEGYGDRIRMIAARLAGLDAPDEATQAINQLLSAPETTFDNADGLRMKAQYLVATGNMDIASATFGNQMTVFDFNPELRVQFAASYASGINQYVGLLHLAGQDNQALTINNRILSDTEVAFPDGARQAAYLNKLSLCGSLNDCAGVISTADDLFAEFPKYGLLTGEFVPVRLKVILCLSQGLQPAERVQLLMPLFDDPDLASFSQRLDVGTAAMNIAVEGDDRNSGYDIATKMLEVLDTYGATWVATVYPGVERVTNESLALFERSVLSFMQSAESYGRPEVALAAYSRLINLARSQQEHEYYSSQYEQAKARLSP